MNNLENILILKYGGIHIKPENKGKFTDYCGGKVTQECIQRGKHSSNPTTRKRATFAANARAWKHQEGGVLNTAGKIAGGFVPFYGTYLNWKDYKENPNNYKGNIADVSTVIRVALTSSSMTPDLYELMKLLGTTRINERI